VTLALIYLSVAISCLFVSNITSKIGESKSLAIASILTVPYYFVFLLITEPHYNADKDSFIFHPLSVYLLVTIASIINGFASALLWVSQGSYFS
jgi:hypothetical protein